MNCEPKRAPGINTVASYDSRASRRSRRRTLQQIFSSSPLDMESVRKHSSTDCLPGCSEKPSRNAVGRAWLWLRNVCSRHDLHSIPSTSHSSTTTSTASSQHPLSKSSDTPFAFRSWSKSTIRRNSTRRSTKNKSRSLKAATISSPIPIRPKSMDSRRSSLNGPAIARMKTSRSAHPPTSFSQPAAGSSGKLSPHPHARNSRNSWCSGSSNGVCEANAKRLSLTASSDSHSPLFYQPSPDRFRPRITPSATFSSLASSEPATPIDGQFPLLKLRSGPGKKRPPPIISIHPIPRSASTGSAKKLFNSPHKNKSSSPSKARVIPRSRSAQVQYSFSAEDRTSGLWFAGAARASAITVPPTPPPKDPTWLNDLDWDPSYYDEDLGSTTTLTLTNNTPTLETPRSLVFNTNIGNPVGKLYFGQQASVQQSLAHTSQTLHGSEYEEESMLYTSQEDGDDTVKIRHLPRASCEEREWDLDSVFHDLSEASGYGQRISCHQESYEDVLSDGASEVDALFRRRK